MLAPQARCLEPTYPRYPSRPRTGSPASSGRPTTGTPLARLDRRSEARLLGSTGIRSPACSTRRRPEPASHGNTGEFVPAGPAPRPVEHELARLPARVGARAPTCLAHPRPKRRTRPAAAARHTEPDLPAASPRTEPDTTEPTCRSGLAPGGVSTALCRELHSHDRTRHAGRGHTRVAACSAASDARRSARRSPMRSNR